MQVRAGACCFKTTTAAQVQVIPAPANLTFACCTHRFRLGRQEDSHEFLRCLLDAMHEACLKPFQPKPHPDLAATTFVCRIFGGKLRSQVRAGDLELSS